MDAARTPPQDGFGRRIRYVRVSLTDKCNFRCEFCMPERRDARDGEAAPLAPDERRRLCAILFGLGVDNFKITGGEPFLAPDAVPLMRYLKQDLGAAGVTVTTNGTTLDRYAAELAAIGVDGVNISLGALSPDAYRKLTGSAVSPERILANALLAKRLGLAVKLNMVPIRGVNETEIVPLLEFALDHGLHMRFIELMPIGRACEQEGVPLADVVRTVEGRFGRLDAAGERLGNGPAAYYAVPGRDARVGFIAAVSERFCAGCNRVRLAGGGFLKTCLHHRHGVALAPPLRAGETDAQLADRIRAAVADKPEGHRFGEDRVEEAVPMYRIGG